MDWINLIISALLGGYLMWTCMAVKLGKVEADLRWEKLSVAVLHKTVSNLERERARRESSTEL